MDVLRRNFKKSRKDIFLNSRKDGVIFGEM